MKLIAQSDLMTRNVLVRNFLAFLGPGLLVAVGYMDPEIGLHQCKVAHNLVILYYL